MYNHASQNLSERQSKIFSIVSKLYKNSDRQIAQWLWKNHVQVVAENALALAKKYDANADFAYAGALLHDLADVWMERTDEGFEPKSRHEAEKILNNSGFNSSEITIILGQIIEPHSCYPGNMPQVLEAKILATADSMAHINTNFYHEFKRMRLPKQINPKDFNTWAKKKLERDFHTKIHFEVEREASRDNYKKLVKDFK